MCCLVQLEWDYKRDTSLPRIKHSGYTSILLHLLPVLKLPARFFASTTTLRPLNYICNVKLLFRVPPKRAAWFLYTDRCIDWTLQNATELFGPAGTLLYRLNNVEVTKSEAFSSPTNAEEGHIVFFRGM